MKKEQLNELLYQALETELGGVQVYTTALKCAANADLKEEWEEYLGQTQNHVRIVRDLFGKLGLDPEAQTPGRQVVKHIGGALVEAMHSKGIRAGLDVFAIEPTSAVAEFADPIAKEASVYGTHHIGASTDQAQEAIAAEAVRIIQSFKETGQVPNVVNLAQRTPATHRLVVRHRDRPGVLAQVLDAIKAEHINVQEMENIVFEGAEAAVARINLDKAPSSATLDRLRAGNADIIELDLLTLQ